MAKSSVIEDIGKGAAYSVASHHQTMAHYHKLLVFYKKVLK